MCSALTSTGAHKNRMSQGGEAFVDLLRHLVDGSFQLGLEQNILVSVVCNNMTVRVLAFDAFGDRTADQSQTDKSVSRFHAVSF